MIGNYAMKKMKLLANSCVVFYNRKKSEQGGNDVIRLIAFDLDGTALDDHKKILPATKKMLEEAAHQGIEIVPATGRPLCGLPEEIRQLAGVNYVLTCNGAGVYEWKTGKCLYEDSIPLTDFLPLMEEIEALPVMADPFLKGESFMSEKKRPLVEKMSVVEEVKNYIRTSRQLVPDLVEYLKQRGDDIEKLTINFVEEENGHRQGYEEVVEILKQYPEMNAISGGMHNIEVTRQGVSKGSALAWLGRYLHIDPREVIAFGDSGNDIELLRTAGIGVAMGNGEEAVKKVADFVTKTNKEDGIVFGLRKYKVLEKRGRKQR